MSEDNDYQKYWETIPETKKEWDLLPKEVRHRLSVYAFIDSSEGIGSRQMVGFEEYLPNAIRKELWLPKKDEVKQAWPVKILDKIKSRSR